MRILTISTGFPSKDDPRSFIFIWNQMKALIGRGHEFRVLRVVPQAPPWTHRWRAYRAVPAAYLWENQPVRGLRAIVPPRNAGLGFTRLQLRRAMEREISEFRPDIVHAHGVIPSGFYALGWGIPVVITAHGGDAYAIPYVNRGVWEAARRAVGNAAAVVATSEYVRSHVVRMGAKESSVIYNGADEKRFFPSERSAARKSLAIDQDRFVVGFVGGLLQGKGVFELVAALKEIRDLRPLALMAGPGPCRESLEDALRKGDVEARFYGALEHEELPAIYAASDAIALPSHAEGFPCVLPETMLAGRVLVATPVGGIPEMVEDGRTGLLVPPRDPGALAAALRRIHDDFDAKGRIEAQARSHALGRLTWHANAAGYERVYAKALGVTDLAMAGSCGGQL